jgi:phosphoglycolate phosphatase
VQSVLFDLDGTLLDTAPDMVPVLADLMVEEGCAPLPYPLVRSHVSNGSAGLVRLAFPQASAERLAALQARYLARYAARLARETRLFPGFDALLASLEARGLAWGVVTNKPGHLTEPLLAGLGLRQRAACVVSGDTLPERKPHPRPVQHAITMAGAIATRSIYVGDARRDIDAGRGAGTRTIAAAYGYIPPDEDPWAWGADAVVTSVAELGATIDRLLD